MLDMNGTVVISTLNEFGEFYFSSVIGEQGYIITYSGSEPIETPKSLSGGSDVIATVVRLINKNITY